MSLQEFKVLEKLGLGAYSSVYKVERLLDHEVYALKKVNLNGMTNKEKQNALNEIRILASVRHPCVIGYREAFFDENSRSLCIIMEYADKGDLEKKITQKINKGTQFQQKQVWSMFIQIVRGLKALHSKNILHRDLKSANVFLMEDGRAKLGDMNVSKISKKGLCQTQTGTPYYASPQVWKDQVYGMKSDIWSLGCVLYEMVCLKPPFQAQDMQMLYQKVTKAQYPKIMENYSSDLKDLIHYLLKVDPHKRPSCQRILNMAIVTKRIKGNEEFYENPQFLETIRLPTDIYYLTEHLPKPNYYTPQKTVQTIKQGIKNKPLKQRLRSHQYSANVPKINLSEVSKKEIHTNSRNYLINNRTIIEAARQEIKHEKTQIRDVEKDIILHRERMGRRKKEKDDRTKNEKKKGLNLGNKMEEIQRVYQGIKKMKKQQ